MDYYIESIGRIVGDREQFEINGTTYSAGWLATASAEEIAQVEALPVEDVYPAITESQSYGAPTISVLPEKVIRTYSVRDKSQTELREEAKAKRAAAVASIVVSIGGKTFNGDEESQTRMARAIIALDAAGQTNTTWVLTDNSPATVTRTELAQALAAAGAEQTRLWVLP